MSGNLLKAYTTHNRDKMPADKWLTITKVLRESEEFQKALNTKSKIPKVATWAKK